MNKKLFILLGCICYACTGTSSLKKETTPASPYGESNIPKKNDKTLSGDFIFVSYNDNGHYTFLNVQKKGQKVQFINDVNKNRTLLRGDEINVNWKKDTIHIAGERTPFPVNVLVSVTKLKDGNVSEFRNHYRKTLSYHWSPDYNYTKSYLDQLYLITEYYIANSRNQLLLHLIDSNTPISYSIEQQVRENSEYTVLGIASAAEHKNLTVQWLFYDREKELLYEYDLPNDQLRYFDAAP